MASYNITPPTIEDYFSVGPQSMECNRLHRNGTFITIYNGFGGIPENFIINLCGLMIGLLLFALLRKKAWNYGRIALVQKSEKEQLVWPEFAGYNIWTQLFYGTDDAKDEDQGSLASYDTSSGYFEKNLCSWISAIFQITDEQIKRKSGSDAVQYLSFQRHIICYTAIVTFISLTVALPINFQGSLQGGQAQFAHTTLSNLEPDSPLLWVHVTLPIAFLILGVLLMRRFSTRLQFHEGDTAVCKTLMIINVPKDMCSKHYLIQHFNEAYPDLVVQDVQFAYDISKLIRLDQKREYALEAKINCETYMREKGTRPEMRPFTCGTVCVCCDCVGAQKVDAIDFYSQEESDYADQVDSEKAHAMERPLGIAFVTFHSSDMANLVFKDYQDVCKCLSVPATSSLSRDLKTWKWQLKFAPAPDDIYWGNLSDSKSWHTFKVILVNTVLFFMLFFLTTPAIFINLLDVLKVQTQLQKLSPVLSQILPALLLWFVATLLPNIVTYSDHLLNHWTRSGENHAIMRKTFLFLLFMLLILPSLGLTSAQAMLKWFGEKNVTYRWDCVFLPDNGALFVNYCITAGLFGNAMELLRFTELLMFVIRLCLSRSWAEQGSIRKAILWEFAFGRQYAWMLLTFAITITYSLVCPLITPFGLVYLCFKHLVDRYNIFFAYGPSKINKKIHATAINFVIASIFMLQMALLFFSLLRRGLAPITVFSITACVITVLVFLGQVFFNFFKSFRPISYSAGGDPCDKYEGSPRKFIPALLQNEPPAHDIDGKNAKTPETPEDPQEAKRDYGSTSPSHLPPGSSVPDKSALALELLRETQPPQSYQNYSAFRERKSSNKDSLSPDPFNV